MLLEVEDLQSYYGSSHVLQGAALAVDSGEIVGLLGRNGMGKSTTLKSIMGLVRPKGGSVRFQNRDITGWEAYRVARAGIGYVPEERRIFSNLTVLENLRMGAKPGIPSCGSGWTLEKLYHHFPFMKDRSAQKGAHLSGGEQQMLAIARALMGNPQLLLVDEPTEGLAPLMVREVRDVLANINKAGVSILIVEHNLKVALSLVSRLYLMGKGSIGFAGTVEELHKRPEIQEQYLSL
ncbi:MAG: ABC transporter ATP-binding protein [Thermodesulfobacteriota bacterium]